MAIPSPQSGGVHLPRHDGMEAGHRSDPYREEGCPAQPCVCPDCGATVREGRWTWQAAEPGAAAHRCPACRRIHDRVPAGEIRLEGAFFADHEQEILRLLHHTEARFRDEHPLERRMSLERDPAHGRMLVSFTGTHITHGVAAALLGAFAGRLVADWPEGGAPLRVRWSR